MRKLLSSVVANVIKYMCPLDAHACKRSWVVFSHAVFYAACLVKLLKLINFTGHNVARETVTS
jgi:hypothetical protein